MRAALRTLTPHAPLPADLQARGVLQFMGPFLTMEADDCGDGMFCLRVG